jgi:hypothetical protein
VVKISFKDEILEKVKEDGYKWGDEQWIAHSNL